VTISIRESLKTIVSWMLKNAPKTLKGLNPPATQAEIERVEFDIGMKLPESFKEFLSIHNGEAWDAASLLGDDNRLLSCVEIVEQYRLGEEIGASVDDPEFSAIEFWKDRVSSQVFFVKGAVKPILRHPKWIPITNMNGDILRYIDFDPAPTGVSGQIIEVDAEGCTYEVLANSFDEFLADYAAQLPAGHFEFRSGSRARLPAPSPLRTVRASFPAYGSSLSKASFDTRLHNCVFGVILSSTAMEMVHLEIS
jgi:cell wall assembly regulator SMI1